jgi:D-3-phosphoglycerate dehydrogenase
MQAQPVSSPNATVAHKRVLVPRPIDHLPGAEDALAESVEIIRAPGLSQDDLLQVIGAVHGIVVGSSTEVTARLIDNAPLLQVIATPAAGFDRIDVAAATQAAVPVVANSGVAPEPVAEMAIGLMIAWTRRIVASNRDMHQAKSWSARVPYADPRQHLGIELSGCTIGIVGLGSIGSTLARMCHAAFGSRLLAYDPYVSQERMAALGVEKIGDLRELAGQVDFLLLHVLLTPETYHLVDRRVIYAMKQSGFLINCARGPVVDEQALVQALQEGWIAGAALDVFDPEPLRTDSPLWSMDNVILTPHIAGVTLQGNKRRGAELVRRLLSVLRVEQPDGLVNPEVWPKYLERMAQPTSV